GINTLLVSNAAGSLVPTLKTGELLIIEDHINLIPINPLAGANIDRLGPRFPDMSQPYDKNLISDAIYIAQKNKISASVGVYISVPGPNLETAAEYRYLKTIGGHA